MDGLTHPRDLEAWHRWQYSRQPVGHRLRRMAGVLRDIARPDRHAGDVVLTRGGPEPRVVVCLESRSPSSVLALLAPLRYLDPADVAVVSPTGVGDLLPQGAWTETTGFAPDVVAGAARGGSVVLSTGHSLPLGELAHRSAEPGRFLTVQHGLMTPHAPPLASGTILLAWSDADATFWRSGRDDVGSVQVGSQLLWDAAEPPLATPDPDAAPVFLGQLHRTELPREVLAKAAEGFCRAHGATYRPHPFERDRASLATHARWEARASPSTAPASPCASSAPRWSACSPPACSRQQRPGCPPGSPWPTRRPGCASSGSGTASRSGAGRPRHHPNDPRSSPPSVWQRSCRG